MSAQGFGNRAEERRGGEGLQEEASEASEFYINQLITLAVVTCIITGQYATGGIVGIILVIGHVLEERCMLGSNEAIGSLLNLSRTHARRLDAQGNEEEEASHIPGRGKGGERHHAQNHHA